MYIVLSLTSPGFDSMPRIEESIQVDHEGREPRSKVRRGIETNWKDDKERRKMDEESRNYITLSRFGTSRLENKSPLRCCSVLCRYHTPKSFVGKGGSAA